MNNKYKLTDDTITINGHKLYRIQALKDFAIVKAGDLGGYIENESNLSHADNDNSWVYNDSIVYDSKIMNNSKIFNSKIINNSTVFNSAVFNSTLKNNSKIINNSTVFNNSKIMNHSTVFNSIINDSKIMNNSKIFNSKIMNTSTVFNSKIMNNATIDNLKINKTTDIIVHGPIGSRNAMITICKNQNYVATTCWSGTKEEFLKRVKETHGDNEHAVNYRNLINFIFGK